VISRQTPPPSGPASSTFPTSSVSSSSLTAPAWRRVVGRDDQGVDPPDSVSLQIFVGSVRVLAVASAAAVDHDRAHPPGYDDAPAAAIGAYNRGFLRQAVKLSENQAAPEKTADARRDGAERDFPFIPPQSYRYRQKDKSEAVKRTKKTFWDGMDA
jgi:hypothetical protein